MYPSLDQSERYRRPPQSDQLDNPEILYLDIKDAEWVTSGDIASWSPGWTLHDKDTAMLAIDGVKCVGYLSYADDRTSYHIDFRPGYESIIPELIKQSGVRA